MRRPTDWVLAAIGLYTIAWFLPVHEGVKTLTDGALPGWEAVMFASRAYIDGHEDSLIHTALIRFTAWSNLLFISTVVVLVLSRPSAYVVRVAAVVLIVAGVLNSQFLYWADSIAELRLGYYCWLAAFLILGIGCWRVGRLPDDTTKLRDRPVAATA